ncbi:MULTISPECIES: SDR family oxidoreductase [unclassified Saccharopolyspora]|uniref:SDR family oxidoreductase n=1 Tax=unclassified Saccharopolyspora TaxID=2646250 RepID=UPI001CD53E1A|nr:MULTISPECIES: SDR family oxidoreductase [unclassified Saccharopolyspora]MCA1186648.1 SDR family oxidoreductase [Saccharopolyspora sp. 6T]MCA1191787.1 SDR family oxidoreductase [Saccharopolyspora sp. 6V]MCA1227336.1 SDR family oxidoreductase [Saccharopolyspora sp. 6M]MCA1281174.1 SDR family oxidoreductase [Saccharopolyspora sp. 7B]
MRIVVAGGHGKIARHFGRLLAERGDTAVGLIRDPAHADDLRADGAEPVVLDLESTDAATLAAQLTGADGVVFAAGAGPGSGIERKDTVDRAGSVLLAEAAQQAGVRRFLQVSAINVDQPKPADVGEVFSAYLDAKLAAEQDLRARDLDWTILRPGSLTDDAPTGRVELAERTRRDDITRADVAAVLVALLDEPKSTGRVLTLINGDVPVVDAVRAAVA